MPTGSARVDCHNSPSGECPTKKEMSVMSQKVIQQIPLDKIILSKQIRERFDDESLIGLAQSMREIGQQEPIHVTSIDGERYSVVTGGRRVRAMRKAGQTMAAAIVEESDLTRSDVLLRQITENAQREDLTPLEKAKAIDTLMKEAGWSATQVAAKLGLSNATISKLLPLLSLPDAIQQRLRSGELPATAAYELAHVDDVSEQARLAGQVASGELTRDALSGTIRARKRKQKARKSSGRRVTRVTARLENRQSVIVRAPMLDWNAFLGILKVLLSHAESAHAQGITLEASLKHPISPATAVAGVGATSPKLSDGNSSVPCAEELRAVG
jgi:ParB family chromosome partitioning protein